MNQAILNDYCPASVYKLARLMNYFPPSEEKISLEVILLR